MMAAARGHVEVVVYSYKKLSKKTTLEENRYFVL